MKHASETEGDDHPYANCTRAFGALALAHALVAAELEVALGESVGLSINEFDVLVGLDAAADKSLPSPRCTVWCDLANRRSAEW